MSAFREWIPVRERLPEVDGTYETLVMPLLEDQPFKRVQKYIKQAHPAISGWQHVRVTHWRPIDSRSDK